VRVPPSFEGTLRAVPDTMLCFERGIPLIVPGTHYADSKALKLQSVSPLYNA
jgi:hypothetical protein